MNAMNMFSALCPVGGSPYMTILYYYQARAKRGRPQGGRAERGLFTN